MQTNHVRLVRGWILGLSAALGGCTAETATDSGDRMTSAGADSLTLAQTADGLTGSWQGPAGVLDFEISIVDGVALSVASGTRTLLALDVASDGRLALYELQGTDLTQGLALEQAGKFIESNAFAALQELIAILETRAATIPIWADVSVLLERTAEASGRPHGTLKRSCGEEAPCPTATDGIQECFEAVTCRRVRCEWAACMTVHWTLYVPSMLACGSVALTERVICLGAPIADMS